MIISVEGIDGAGKNTLVTALKKEISAEIITFPRYADSIEAQLASQALHGHMGDLIDSAYGMATLFALDRYGAKEQLRDYAENPDKILILDRYVASNAAYSYARTGDESIIDWVYHLEYVTLGLARPDLQVLLETHPDIAARRAADRESADQSRKRDRYEQDQSLQERTFKAYQKLANLNWGGPWLITTSAEEVLDTIRGE